MKAENIAFAFTLFCTLGMFIGMYLGKNEDMRHYMTLWSIWYVGFLILREINKIKE